MTDMSNFESLESKLDRAFTASTDEEALDIMRGESWADIEAALVKRFSKEG